MINYVAWFLVIIVTVPILLIFLIGIIYGLAVMIEDLIKERRNK